MRFRGASDPLTLTLVVLTFVTGIVDAAAFLALGQVFAAMQTGNVIFLGFGLADATEASVVAPLVGLAAFLAGGAIAALIRADGPGRLGRAMVVEVALLGAVAVTAAAVDVVPDELVAYLLIAGLSLAMGLRNTTARTLGDPNLATTVLNLTLTAVAAHTPMRIASGTDVAERAVGFAAILLGALTGALLLKTSLTLAIATAAVISAAAGIALVASERRALEAR